MASEREAGPREMKNDMPKGQTQLERPGLEPTFPASMNWFERGMKTTWICQASTPLAEETKKEGIGGSLTNSPVNPESASPWAQSEGVRGEPAVTPIVR